MRYLLIVLAGLIYLTSCSHIKYEIISIKGLWYECEIDSIQIPNDTNFYYAHAEKLFCIQKSINNIPCGFIALFQDSLDAVNFKPKKFDYYSSQKSPPEFKVKMSYLMLWAQTKNREKTAGNYFVVHDYN